MRSMGCHLVPHRVPMVHQFTVAHKRLLMRHNVKGGLGHCALRDTTTILSVTLNSIPVNGLQQDTLDMSAAHKYNLQPGKPLASNYDYVKIFNKAMLSQYKVAVVSCIAGYVVRMVKRKIHCVYCHLVLTTEAEMIASVGSQFILQTTFHNRTMALKLN